MVNYKSKALNGDTITPISVFNRIQGKRKFLLESSVSHGEKGRFSFIGLNPYKEIIGTEIETKIINHSTGTNETVQKNHWKS
ncbi:anthranilate synthase [Gracilibacillus boraciitolerans JCM 21714]|uniref:Anthranilate synthase n=1 Tax=Gracilibacillus boraciitolerans JCM 21714 TaxID=1298598 RepID=W4VMG4_9BACI|nr:anthranilate synthase [Gracilibacillus boraciitolerans JCM 21714]